jgi:tRNA 2-thiouridine synthesizing protein A
MTLAEEPRPEVPSSTPPAETLLDLRGLNCPLPVLKSRRALAKMPPGTRLRALATDPMSAIDIPHMCNEDGHRLLSASEVEGRLEFLIERG